MKKQINLIPNELVVTPRTVKLTKIVNRLSIFGAIILIVISSIVVIYFIYLNNEYQKVLSDSLLLKNGILNLEQSEQKLILAKNKLNGIRTIKKLNFGESEIYKLKLILDNIFGMTDSKVSEVNFFNDKNTEITLTASDSSSLSNLLKTITALGLYKNITLQSVNLNANKEYLISLLLSNK